MNSTSSKIKWILALGVAVFGLWMYGAALGLPSSLVDDYVLIHHHHKWLSDWNEGGLAQALKNDASISQRVYNTGFWLLGLAEYHLTNDQPFHWFKLLELVFVCTIILFIIVVVEIDNKLGFYVALIAIAVFLAGEVPGNCNMQSLRANWYRLFATDSDGLVLIAAHMVCIFSMLRRFEDREVSIGLILGAVVTGVLTFTIKLPFIVVICGPLVFLGTAVWLRGLHRLSYLYAGIFATILVSFVIYNIVLRGFSNPTDTQAYGSNYSIAPAHLISGLKQYGWNYWITLGPLIVAVLAGLVITIVSFCQEERYRTSLFITFYILVFTICAIGIYFPWNSRLPRYMLTGIFGITLLSGIVFNQLIALVCRGSKWNFVFVLVGILMTLLAPMFLLCTVSILCILGVFKRRALIAATIMGVGLAGVIYILAVSPITRSAMNNLYCGTEEAGWNTTVRILGYSAQNRVVCFAGNAANEQVGSMAGHIRRMGVQPQIYSTADKMHCTSDSLVLVNQWLSPPEEKKQLDNWPVVFESGLPASSFKVMISFWEFRERLVKKSEGNLFWNEWKFPYVWKIYSKAVTEVPNTFVGK